jgi:hypothetical protein
MDSFNPTKFAFMQTNMQPADRIRMAELLRELARNGTYVGGVWRNPHWAAGTPESQLYELVQQELYRCTLAFMRTSTLQDRIPQEDADAIYLLGKYIALVTLPYVQYELTHSH